MPPEENVTSLPYRRRQTRSRDSRVGGTHERAMAFDPFLVFTVILVSGAMVAQAVLVVSLEF